MDEECTCGKKIGACRDENHDLVTWRDANGEMHVNGTGVVLDVIANRPDLTGAPEWTTRVRGETKD